MSGKILALFLMGRDVRVEVVANLIEASNSHRVQLRAQHTKFVHRSAYGCE